MASSVKRVLTGMCDDQVCSSHKVKVTILASEWGSSKGGLSTINRELAIQLAKCPEVEITFFLPQCSQEDRTVALQNNVKIMEATPLPGFEQLEWLSFPPDHLQIDIIVGHGVKLGKQALIIKKSKKCKWLQVVHTDPEELGMFKKYSNPISKGEEKHKTEVELCKMADHVVGVGPKLSEAFRSYLRSCRKDDTVLDFTPGTFEEFAAVKQVPSERQQCSVLVFGCGDVEDFELKGFDIAGKAIAALEDTRLVFVGAPDGKHEEIAKQLTECGVPERRLRVRGFVKKRESLKELFQEVDLVIMPSRTEGFGLTGLEALSAGLPVLISSNSGFGEALCSVPFGSTYVVNSDEPAEWTSAIKKIWGKDRKSRLEEAKMLRDSFDKKYNWARQIKDLSEKMISWVHDDSSNHQRYSETKCSKGSQCMEGITEDIEDASDMPKDVSVNGKQPVAKTHASASGFSGEQCPVDEPKTEDAPRLSEESPSVCHTPSVSGLTSDQETANTVKMSITACDLSSDQEDVVDGILRQQLKAYLEYNKTNKLSTASGLSDFIKHLENTYKLTLTSVGVGSLVIKVQCPDLQSLERLWNDYCSGLLNEAAERFLVTDDVKKENNLVTLRLKTIIEEESYFTCKKALMKKSAISRSVSPSTESDQEAASLLIDTSAGDSKDLQRVQEDVSESLKIAVSDFSKIEKDNMVESVQRLKSIEHVFQMMDSRVDISTFVQANNPGKYTPPVKSFTQNLGENKLFLVDATEPVLKRKYIALQKKLRDFDKSIKKDHEEVKSLKQEQESYSRNPSYGKSGEVEQDLLRQRNDLRVNEWFCCVAKEQTKLFTRDVLDRLNVTEDDPQDETISDDESSVTGTVDKRLSVHVKGKKIKKAGQHEFEDHTFKKPTKCFYCNGFIMIGLRGQGVWCKACKMNVHRKCRDNVPYCRGEIPVGKGQSLRIQRTDEDDSDENSFSDDEDVPDPPPRRRALGPTVSLPAFRSNAVSDTAESKGSSTANNYCVALYDFGGEKDEDLKLCAGEKVKVINNADEHWWEGSSKGKTGFFPASYVQVISPDDVILRCLYDFAGKEEDKLTIQAEQIIVQVRNEGNGWIVGQRGSVEGAFPASYVEVLSNNGPD